MAESKLNLKGKFKTTSLRLGDGNKATLSDNSEIESEAEVDAGTSNGSGDIYHTITSQIPNTIHLFTGMNIVLNKAAEITNQFLKEQFELLQSYLLKHLNKIGKKIMRFLKQFHIEIFLILFILLGWFCCFYANILGPYRTKKKAKKKLELLKFLAELADQATTCTDVESGYDYEDETGSSLDTSDMISETESETESASI